MVAHASLLVRAAAVFTLLAPAAFAGDWYVDAAYANCSSSTGSASQPFCTIPPAIQAASSGDTIHVAPGTYDDAVLIDRSLTLVGTQGAAVTILDGHKVQGVMAFAPGVTADLSGLSIVKGISNLAGGAFVATGATVTFRDCVFRANANTGSNGAGGAIAVQQADVVLERCTLEGNTCVQNGGAIGISGGSLTLLDCDLHDNRIGSVTMFALSGGALCVTGGATLEVERSGFTSNGYLESSGAYGCQGGAISSAQSTVVLRDCTFSGNDAGIGEGGALYGVGISAADCVFERNSAHSGGAIHAFGVTCERCRFEDNTAVGFDSFGGRGGVGGAATCLLGGDLTDCSFEGNVAHGIGFVGPGTAGALSISAPAWNPASVVRSRFAHNRAEGSVQNGGIGGALHIDGQVALSDCEVVENVADGSQYVVAGFGGGAVLANSAAASLVRCTVAGNRADFQNGTASAGGLGGGLFVGSSCDLDHCVVAGNFAYSGATHDVYGTVDSLGWNDVGDTNGATITGPGTNDLLDVDPQFADAANGDFRLAATSPCVDSGDATLARSGRDVARNPRLLDGDLDGALVLDRGAHEFSNVALQVTGSATPGGVLAFDTTGTAGLPVFLVAGAATSELAVKKFGALFVDLAAPFLIVPFGTIPNSQNVAIDPSLPVPLTVYLQEAALAPGAGNFGNLVTLDVE